MRTAKGSPLKRFLTNGAEKENDVGQILRPTNLLRRTAPAPLLRGIDRDYPKRSTNS